MSARLMFLHALSPVHAGTGQSLGAIDLAIARDRATDMPYIPGSSIKGTLRGLAQDKQHKDTIAVFGPETAEASEHSGSLVVGDANLLLLPVRSVAGTFAWVTSPLLLARFARDCKEAGLKDIPGLSDMAALQECRTCKDETRLLAQGMVIFEDLDLKPTSISATPWADFIGKLLFPGDDFWQAALKQKLCIVHDDIMAFFARHAVDVSARIRMNPETHTVAKGALWYEENLPAEAVLTSLLLAAPPKKAKVDAQGVFKLVQEMTQTSIQLGGNATVGRGRCRAVLANQGGK